MDAVLREYSSIWVRAAMWIGSGSGPLAAAWRTPCRGELVQILPKDFRSMARALKSARRRYSL